MASNLPTCADTCISNAIAATFCNQVLYCLCTDQTYVSAAIACLQEDCAASDQVALLAYGNQECDAVGAYNVFPTSITPTVAVTTTAAADPPSTTAASQGGTTPASSSSGSGSSGLSAGDIAGIVGAVCGVISVIVGILAWRLPKTKRENAWNYVASRFYPQHHPQDYQMANNNSYVA